MSRVAYIPEVLEGFLKAVGCISDGKLEEAFEYHKDAFSYVGDLYKEVQEEWLLNLMRKLARSLRLLAQKVDKETVRLDPIMVSNMYVARHIFLYDVSSYCNTPLE